MTCLEVQDLLSAFIDNELDEEKMKEIQDHIEKCPVCKQDVTELKRMLSELSGLKDVPVPEIFHERLHEALVQEGISIRNSRNISIKHKKKIMWKRLYSLAAVFLVGLFSVILYNNNLDDFFSKQALNYSYVADDQAPVKEKSKAEDIQSHKTDKGASNANDSASSNMKTTPKESVSSSSNKDSGDVTVKRTPKTLEPEKASLQAGGAALNQAPVNAPSQNKTIESQPDMFFNSVDNTDRSEKLKSINLQNVNEELSDYLDQLDKTLAESNYEIISCTQNDEGNMWIIDITITTVNSEGQEVKEDAVYCGQDGKLWKKEL